MNSSEEVMEVAGAETERKQAKQATEIPAGVAASLLTHSQSQTQTQQDAKPRRKGRPRKATPAPPLGAFPRELLASVYRSLFEVLAKRLGDHWRLSDSEAGILADSLGAVIDRYLPSLSSHGELVVFVTVHVGVLLPRLQTPKRASSGVSVHSGA